MDPRGHVRWRAGSPGLIVLALVLIASLAALNGRGAFGAEPGDSPAPSVSSATSNDPAPSDVRVASPSLPDRTPATYSGVWFSEIAFEQWAAGELRPGRAVRLPAGAVPITGGAGLVVTGVRSANATRLAVWDIRTGRARIETDVPFNVTGAAVAQDGSMVYLTGATGDQTIVDAGVAALVVETGTIEQLVPAASLRPEWEGNGARGELVVSPNRKILAATLCGAPIGALESTCDVTVIDLASGRLIGAFGPVSSYVAAVTDEVVVTRTQLGIFAFDFAGTERWRFEAGEIRGPIAAVSDGVVAAYAPPGTVGPTRIGKFSASAGAITDLLVADGEGMLSIWPLLSDAVTIVVAEAPPMEFAFGAGNVAVVLSTIDAATGAVTRNALHISPEG